MFFTESGLAVVSAMLFIPLAMILLRRRGRPHMADRQVSPTCPS